MRNGIAVPKIIEILSLLNKIKSNGDSNDSNLKRLNVQKQIENITNNKNLVNKYIMKSNEFLDTFKSIAKDVVILLDISYSMKKDPKKLDNALKKISNIYDVYISSKDNFIFFEI